jgi:predicted phosphodiesterase
MESNKTNLISRRQAILSLATITAGTLVKPASIFGVEPVKNKVRFAVIGDWGTGCEEQAGICRMMIETHKKSAFDFILAAGDNIYPNGSGRYFSKKFEQPFAKLLEDQVKFYAVLGNHDVEEGRQDQTTYPLFNMAGKNYYTVSKGDGLVDFFMLDTTDYHQAQAFWLENALKTSTAKWKIALFHHPLYSSGKKHGSNPKLRMQIEPLFIKYGVTVAFAGHDHMYERVKVQQGVQHFVTGAGGKMRRGDINRNSGITAASFSEDNHFMLIEVDDKEVRFEAISEQGNVVDNGALRV